jgi:hypothetical protein
MSSDTHDTAPEDRSLSHVQRLGPVHRRNIVEHMLGGATQVA